MLYKFTFFIFNIFILQNLNAQLEFCTISGTICGSNSGKIYLVPVVNDSKYYGKTNFVDSADILNNFFVIHRKIYDENIYAYRLLVKSNTINGITNLLFLSPKNEKICVDSVNEFVSPIIENSTVQNEMKFEYEPFFKKLIQETNKFEITSNDLNRKYGNSIPNEENLNLTMKVRELTKMADSLFLNMLNFILIHI